MFKRKGEGVKGLLNNVKKNCTFLTGWLPLRLENIKVKWRQTGLRQRKTDPVSQHKLTESIQNEHFE